jgi:hypothetical protein
VSSAWRQSRAGTAIVAALWLFAILLGGAVALEFLLQQRSVYKEAHDQRRYSVLARAYAPFFSESLHPQYLFFFPSTAAARRAMGNATCSIDEHGFREPGVEQIHGRKLAFLVGGSVAFGLFASSNDTTITSALNRLQSEYFFVNAGVPGFNSTQELVRLTVELADYQPALVIALDGWNDLTLARDADRIERQIPPGTPEAFPALEQVVESAHSPWRALLPETFFPEISLRLGPRRDDQRPKPVPEKRLEEAAQRYAINRQRMSDVSKSIGARFISVFQPLAALHRHVPEGSTAANPDAESFHSRAIEKQAGVESYDLGRVFDEFFPSIPVGVPAIEDNTIFVDDGHLYDPGNALLARELLKLIQRPASVAK